MNASSVKVPDFASALNEVISCAVTPCGVGSISNKTTTLAMPSQPAVTSQTILSSLASCVPTPR